MSRARNAQLSTQNGGITRLRRKGRADPATMYDCLNAYITISGSIKPRPGTRIHKRLPEGTVGLVAYRGKLAVFTSDSSLVNDDERYIFIVIKHPVSPGLSATACHFAQSFMGFLYCVIEFSDGQYFHFWAEDRDPWEAGTVYAEGAAILPSTPNGYRYIAERNTLNYPFWAAGVARQIGDNVEPTVSNGYYYQVLAVSGLNPRSGDSEPIWPTSEGATIVESQSVTYQAVPPQTTPPSTGTGGGAQPGGRYDNPSFGDARIQK